jgi:uncharacterized MAPEG superfamily protein
MNTDTLLTLTDYALTIYALGATALLMLIQVLAGDLLSIRAKHTPGTPVEADHQNLLFRASRVVANSNETVAIFILLALFCMLSGASPVYTSIGAWGYVMARTAYAFCYYSNVQIMRSVVFGISLLILFALLIIGIIG